MGGAQPLAMLTFARAAVSSNNDNASNLALDFRIALTVI